jgi:hypothetical protein
VTTGCRCRDQFTGRPVANPFRPVTADPRWLTATAVALAQAIYEDRAFDRMPILADALEEAGGDDADLLAHCRSDGPHVRGCWAVDLVLGKGSPGRLCRQFWELSPESPAATPTDLVSGHAG